MEFAYVIPFCKKDFNEVQSLIKLWSTDGHKPYVGKFTMIPLIDLVFYFSDLKTEQVKNVVEPLLNSSKQFFRKIVYQEKILKPVHNVYPIAPGIMFFDFMINTNYTTCFYAEADCLPCKDNWLFNLLEIMATCYKQNDWIYGSMFRGLNIMNRNQLVLKMHINGNAIYNTGLPDFKQFLKTVRTKISLKKPYDTEMMRYVLSSPDEIYNNFFSHIKYVDFVINYGKKPLGCYLKNIPTRTYFIHGRQYQQSILNS